LTPAPEDAMKIHSGWRGLLGVVLLPILLAGCGTALFERRSPERAGQPAGGNAREDAQQSAPERPTAPVNLSGYSPSFRQGYSDGCDSAGSLSQRRNENRYKSETDYMMGWNDGFSVCQRRR
jgi:hypothetical protein